jgi:hypothetical protein
MTITLNGTTGIVNTGSETITGALTAASFNSASTFGFKNRLINSAMVIDQRNAGASVTPSTGTYSVDRWRGYQNVASKFTMQQNAASVTPPTGFKNYLGMTSSSAYSATGTDLFLVGQFIEGYNVADLGWGAAGASSITLSFYVRSSLTGTFGGSLTNSAENRSYPFTYTISVANTWELKSVTVAGDTSGTWLTTTGSGLAVYFTLGIGSTYAGPAGAWAGAAYFGATGATSVVGTNGATFYITGVQLETGTVATTFEYRPYTTELQLCQRYYYLHASNSPFNISMGFYYNSTFMTAVVPFPVTMRVAPSLVQSTGTNYYGIYANSTLDTFDSFNNGIAQPSTQSCGIEVSSGVSGTAGNAGRVVTNNASASIAFNSEL